MWSGKCPVREMPVRGNVLVGKCPVGEVSGRGIVRSGKCPSGKCPSGKCQSGICPRGSVSRGTVQSGNCPHTGLYGSFSGPQVMLRKNLVGYDFIEIFLLFKFTEQIAFNHFISVSPFYKN